MKLYDIVNVIVVYSLFSFIAAVKGKTFLTQALNNIYVHKI